VLSASGKAIIIIAFTGIDKILRFIEKINVSQV
jgi:hypothetical protein